MAVGSDSMHHGMPLPFVQPPASLCIIRLSAIGDTCHAVPVVRAIQDAWPSTQLTWIIGKTEHSLLRGLEGVELIVLDKARGLPRLRGRPSRARRQAVRRAAAHACVGAREHGEPTRALAAAGRLRPRARARSAMAVHEPQAAGAPRASRHGRVVRVRRADRRRTHGNPRWDLPIGADDVAAIAPYFAYGKPTLVISPCTGQRFRNYRNWRVESYAEVADYAAQRYGAQVLVTGGTTADRAELRPRHRGHGQVASRRT